MSLLVRDIRLGLEHALGEPRQRHAHVGREGLRTGTHADDGPVCVVARLPEFCAFLGIGRPGERTAAEIRRNLSEALRLFRDARRRAVEFEEQQRRFRKRQLGIDVAGFDLQFVEQLDARDRNAGLDRRDRGVAGGLDGRKRTDAARNRLGNAVQLHGDFGDDAERAFRTDEQAREIVTGGGFLRAARGRDHLAAREHDLQRRARCPS